MGLMQSEKVQEYIHNVCLQIKNRKIHEEIQAELLGHIEEAAVEQMSSGISEEEALEEAIRQMGDAEVIGKRLHKIHKTQPEWSVLAITLIFAGIGLMTMYFIDTKGALLFNSQVFNRSIASTILGIAVVCGLYLIDYRKLQAYSKHIYIGTLLLLIITLYSGVQVRGTRTLFGFGTFTINIVDISPFLLIFALAGLFDNWNWAEPKKVLYGLGLGAIPAALILAVPSLSACATFIIAFIILTVVSGIRLKHILLATGSGLTLLLYLAMIRHYRIERFLIFLNPARDPEGGGWQNMQLHKIIHSAGLFGQGFNFNPRSLPEVHMGYIFTYIVYTFGWIAGIILAALVIAFLVRITRIAAISRNNYGKLLVIGFASAFAVQFIWNILMNLNLAPLSGFGLPFISFGGTQFVINMAAIGLITNVYKQRSVAGPSI